MPGDTYFCDDCFWIGLEENIIKEDDEDGLLVYISCPQCVGFLRCVSPDKYFDVVYWEESEMQVRICCDFSADGAFINRSAAISPYSLPISRNLAEKIRDWNWWYDIGYNPRKEYFDPEEFTAIWLSLAKQVKQELPDWTVTFWDEIEWDRLFDIESNTAQRQDSSHCEFEIVMDKMDLEAASTPNNYSKCDDMIRISRREKQNELVFPWKIPLRCKGNILTEKDVILPHPRKD